MRSPLKWAGGKGKQIELIQSVLPPPSECVRLIEPFAGGGNVFLNTDYREYILGDANKDLICLYESIKSLPSVLIDKLHELWQKSSSHDYYKIREAFNKMDSAWYKAALFVYLNRHGFNGLCRYNAKGEFNVPFGDIKNPYLPEAEIVAMSKKLNDCQVQLINDDFENVMRLATPGATVYCDPPYVPISATSSFTSYARGGFDMADQVRLAGLAEELSGKGVFVAIHNHDLPVTRELYRNADEIVTSRVRRNISCNGEKREKVGELIAVYRAK